MPDAYLKFYIVSLLCVFFICIYTYITVCYTENITQIYILNIVKVANLLLSHNSRWLIVEPNTAIGSDIVAP